MSVMAEYINCSRANRIIGRNGCRISIKKVYSISSNIYVAVCSIYTAAAIKEELGFVVVEEMFKFAVLATLSSA